jgi:hypothetical protein
MLNWQSLLIVAQKLASGVVTNDKIAYGAIDNTKIINYRSKITE